MNKQEKSLRMKKQWYKRSRKGDYSGLDMWKKETTVVWTRGDVERMKEKRLPNAALHGHVEGRRSRGRQRKTWMDIGQCQGRSEREKHRLDQDS